MKGSKEKEPGPLAPYEGPERVLHELGARGNPDPLLSYDPQPPLFQRPDFVA